MITPAAFGSDVVDYSTAIAAQHINNLRAWLVDSAAIGINSNTETINDDKTLTDDDLPIQVLDLGASSHDLTLPAEANSNHVFYVYNAGSYSFGVYTDGSDLIVKIEPDHAAIVVSDGTTWMLLSSTSLLNLTKIGLLAASEKTLSGDAFTATQIVHKLQPESGTTDDLSAINGLSAGDLILLYVSDAGTDTITFKHGTGNLSIVGGADLDLSEGAVLAYYDGTTVYIIGGGGTASGSTTYLTSPLTSTNYDGDSFSTQSKTLVDLSSEFGVPAGVKAVLVNILARDSGSASAACFVGLAPNTDANIWPMIFKIQGNPNDIQYAFGPVWVPCTAAGDLYLQILATGTGTLDLWWEIWGYEE